MTHGSNDGIDTHGRCWDAWHSIPDSLERTGKFRDVHDDSTPAPALTALATIPQRTACFNNGPDRRRRAPSASMTVFTIKVINASSMSSDATANAPVWS